MTAEALRRNGLPLAIVLLVFGVLWYAAALWLNGPQVNEAIARSGEAWSWGDFIHQAYSMKRPVLPTPDQVGVELYTSMALYPVDSIRNLLFHTYVTASAAVLGFGMALVLGVVLAIGIVQVRTLESSLLPWLIASQTIPILAIAPMVVVILGNMGFSGLLPKAVISMYLCFFPITIGLIKGLRSTNNLSLDLMRTYNASSFQLLRYLRFPCALPYLFASLKISVAASVAGTIVAELPTGGQAGLGARLLSGSYYGQTVQIWAALVMAAVLSVALVAAVSAAEWLVVRSHRGAR